MDNYPIDIEWIGEYDNAPPCSYNPRVGCPYSQCETCGWNPFVAMDRIKTEYGDDAVNYLTINE